VEGVFRFLTDVPLNLLAASVAGRAIWGPAMAVIP